MKKTFRNGYISLKGQRKNMIQLMLDASKNDPSQELSDDEMAGQAIAFLLAGYETTSNMLSFITYMLAIRPDIQDKLADAIIEKFAQVYYNHQQSFSILPINHNRTTLLIQSTVLILRH